MNKNINILTMFVMYLCTLYTLYNVVWMKMLSEDNITIFLVYLIGPSPATAGVFHVMVLLILVFIASQIGIWFVFFPTYLTFKVIKNKLIVEKRD